MLRPVERPPIAGERDESQERCDGHRIAGRGRIVVRILAAGDELLVVLAGVKESAVLRVPKLIEHHFDELLGGCDPARLEGRLVQIDQRFDQVGVILQVAIQPRLDVARQARAIQPAPGRAHSLQQVVRGGTGPGDVLRVVEHLPRPGERRDHQRVPRGQQLVIQPRLDPLLAPLKQLLFAFVKPTAQLGDGNLEQACLLLVAAGAIEYIVPLPVAVRRHIVNVAEQLGLVFREDLFDLRAGPNEKLPLDSLAVRVLCAEKSALPAGHLAGDEGQRVVNDHAVKGVLDSLIGFRVSKA